MDVTNSEHTPEQEMDDALARHYLSMMAQGAPKPDTKKEQAGIKNDANKTRYDLVDWPFVEGMANVMTANVGKHDDDTWKSIKPFRQKHFSALMRHVVKWLCGEKLDAETGLSHLYHAACRLMFLAWGDKNGGEV